MKTITLMLALLPGLSSAVYGQYAKVYYADHKLETEELKVEISNIVATDVEVKFKLELANTTSEFLLFDASKCTFSINGKAYTPKDKFVIIDPYGKKSKTVGITGTGLGEVKEFEIELAGIQRVEMSEEQFATDVFTLPPSKNDFSTGPFFVALKNHKKETAAAFSKFDVQYKGKKIGFVFPAKITTTMPDGKDYANAEKKPDPILLFPGEDSKFSASWERMPGGRVNDMQLVEMKLNFGDVFREGTAVDLPAQKVAFTWDQALTIEKNK